MMSIKIGILSLLTFLSPQISNACDQASAKYFAESFYKSHQLFYLENSPKLSDELTPQFYALLAKEKACLETTKEICKLDYDPWLAAQDGEITEPVKVKVIANSAQRTDVSFAYQFKNGTDSLKRKEVILRLKSAPSPQCWRLADFRTPDRQWLSRILK